MNPIALSEQRKYLELNANRRSLSVPTPPESKVEIVVTGDLIEEEEEEVRARLDLVRLGSRGSPRMMDMEEMS